MSQSSPHDTPRALENAAKIATMDLVEFLEFLVHGEGPQIMFEGHDGWPEFRAVVTRYNEFEGPLRELGAVVKAYTVAP